LTVHPAGEPTTGRELKRAFAAQRP